jgi:drug/metabolite transporter (DMT)-like permease
MSIAKYSAELALVMTTFLWGINPPAMKIGLLYVNPLPYNTARILVALTGAWVILWLSKTSKPFLREDFKPLVMVSVFGFFVFQLFFTVGIQHTSAGNAALILGMLPVSVAIINKIFGLEKITLPILAGIVLSISGVVLIIYGSGSQLSLSGSHVNGVLMLLSAQAGYGYYTVFAKNLLERYSTYQVTAYVFTITTLLFGMMSIPELIEVDWLAVPAPGWFSVLYSGIFPLCIGNFLWIWGAGKIGSNKAAVYNNLLPVFAIAASYLLLGETFGMLQFAGAAVILAGVSITRRKPAVKDADSR